MTPYIYYLRLNNFIIDFSSYKNKLYSLLDNGKVVISDLNEISSSIKNRRNKFDFESQMHEVPYMSNDNTCIMKFNSIEITDDIMVICTSCEIILYKIT